jgi:hypothetical protein
MRCAHALLRESARASRETRATRCVCKLPLLLMALGALALGCKAPQRKPFSYYEERIAPVLDVGCQRQTTGCHIDDGRGFALGNLDLSSYDHLLHRKDVLDPYGPYPVGLLLLKAGGPVQVQVKTVDPPDPSDPDKHYVTITTDVRHGGGEGAIAEGSADYRLLKQWIDGGYPANGVPQQKLSQVIGACVSGAGVAALDAAPEPQDQASYSRFVSQIQPILTRRCAGSGCHGASPADLFLTCGENDRELRWNYWASTRYLNLEAVTSELLRRPLGLAKGGVFHEGGPIFGDTEDKDYRTLLAWAEDLAKRSPESLRFEPGPDEAGLRFFANRVQPMLVRKGCMFLGCHSPSMFHDLRLRGGARGDFSEIATRRNYEMSRVMLALESEDPNNSRLLGKNLCPPESGGRGIKHRGGVLFEDFGGCADPSTRASTDKCMGIDADTGDLNELPAYCVLARWHTLEREQAIARGELTASASPSAVVFVVRPEGVGGPTQFDDFQAGADLMQANASTDAQGHLQISGAHSLLGACGLPASIDVRGPALSWDAKHLAFAARTAQDKPLRIYQMNADGSGCAPIAGLASHSDRENGILLHDFDPTYAPDGTLVFASTRGYIDGEAGFSGPTRTPAALEPNANLYVFDAGADPQVRQLTFLLDQELQPSFMADGRLIFTAEKRGQDFHQLAGRRINLDGGDYHPLFAQRASIGFGSATEIVELANRNFALVAAPLTARDGGGAIVIVNRSIGPDQNNRDPKDKAYIHSMTTSAAGAFAGDTGVFRSPAPLPSGRLLASCDLQAGDLSGASPHYGLCELDPTGDDAPRMLYSDGSHVALEAVAVYPRVPHQFESRADEVNGSTHIDPSAKDAIVHYLDVPLLGTLLFSNTRTGRPIDSRVAGMQVLAPQPPPADTLSLDQLGGNVVMDSYGRYYENLRSLGNAPMAADGSLRIRIPGGTPVTLALTGDNGKVLSFNDQAPFSGPMRQREATQFYPGERAKQAMGRQLFNGVCAGCHGSISGHELDVGVTVDVLTSASRTQSSASLRDLH